MKFPRQNKIFHRHMDAVPYASVFFLLLMFVALSRTLTFTPGVPISLPIETELRGTPNATLVVAVDNNGQLYYESQVISEASLMSKLKQECLNTRDPLTLIIHADKNVKYDLLLKLGVLAHKAGIRDAILATRPALSSTNGIEQAP